jgi:isoquinoline 1-oxidoreductase beta subunit
MTVVQELSRRAFLGAGGVFVLGFSLPGLAQALPFDEIAFGVRGKESPSFDLNAWIRITPEGVATLRMAASEMGQGVFTALPMILAEELDLPWERVVVESAPAAKEFRRDLVAFPMKTQMTGGSESVRGYWTILREAGAAARAMLIDVAAGRWGVDAAECTTELGWVCFGDEKLSYGSLVEDASVARVPSKVRLKEPSEFRLIGTSPPRVDVPAKVDGSACFGIDVQVEGMLHGTVKACPHHGGSLASWDGSAALRLPGVVGVFAVGDAVIVVADTFWHAKRGLDALDIEWDVGAGKGWSDEEIGAQLRAALDKGVRAQSEGRRPKNLSVVSTYEVPYLEHAPIEPLSATAWVQPDRVDVWAPTQAQARNRKDAARLTGVPARDVHVHTTLLGGGFGRKGFADFVNYAIEASKRVEKPVKVTWTREETFARGHYRPRCMCRLSGGLDESGRPTDLLVQIASQNVLEDILPPGLVDLPFAGETVHGGLTDAPYAIERQRIENARVSCPIPVGWWRAVHASHNGFFRECFLDELAHAGGRDPVELRRELLRDRPRYLAVLDLAVTKAGPVAAGQHRGIALFESYGAIVAQTVDLSVQDGKVAVHKIVASVDCGLVVHPENVKAQVMGGATMGLSAALFGELNVSEGAIRQSNFHEYRLLKMSEAPAVEVHLISSNEPPGGVGEIGLPPVAGALCNAIFAATGIRIRRLPVGDQLAV